MGASAGSAEQEHAVGEALLASFQRLLTDRLGTKELPAPTFGPTLHRWGSAFPRGTDSPGEQSACVLPDSRVAFTGDFLAPPYGCLETAMSSGILAAKQMHWLLAAQRYVDLANKHDREG